VSRSYAPRVIRIRRGAPGDLWTITTSKRGDPTRIAHTAHSTELFWLIRYQRMWRWRAYDHEEMPSEKVLKKLRAKRGLI
jgi:hypothetical protein